MEENNLQEKKKYELAYLFSPLLSPADVEKKMDEMKSIIESLGGVVISAALPKKQKLAYTIKKQNSAYFGYFVFEMSSGDVGGLRQKLIYEKEILRYLVFSYQKEERVQKERVAFKDREQGKPEAAIPEEVFQGGKEDVVEEEFKESVPAAEDKNIDLGELDKKLKELFE